MEFISVDIWSLESFLITNFISLFVIGVFRFLLGSVLVVCVFLGIWSSLLGYLICIIIFISVFLVIMSPFTHDFSNFSFFLSETLPPSSSLQHNAKDSQPTQQGPRLVLIIHRARPVLSSWSPGSTLSAHSSRQPSIAPNSDGIMVPSSDNWVTVTQRPWGELKSLVSLSFLHWKRNDVNDLRPEAHMPGQWYVLS